MADPEEVRAVIRGQVDIIAPVSSYFASLSPGFGVFYQPLLFTDVKQAMTLASGSLGRNLLAGLDKQGLKGFGVWQDGPVYLFMTGAPVRTLDEIRGKKIRIFPSAPLEEGFRAVGAIPVAMPPADLFLALRQGVVEGAVGSPAFAAPSRWYEVLKGMTRILMGFSSYSVVINKASWDRLNAQHKDALNRAYADAERWNYAQAVQNIADAEKTLSDNGMALADLTPEQLASWRAGVESVYAKQPNEVRALIEVVKAEAKSSAGR